MEDFDDLKIKIELPEGTPNVAAREDIKITDVTPIVRGRELVNRRWSSPGPGGKPVYNFRVEGRQFGSNRCLILADGFYKPEDPKQKRQDKWLFTLAGHRWFCIAGIWRESPVGEAFTMLTIEPGEDVAPIIPARSCRFHAIAGRRGSTRRFPPTACCLPCQREVWKDCASFRRRLRRQRCCDHG
jgi:putative SOS response-associated peptidase YedK